MVGVGGGRQKDGHCDFIFFCTLGLERKWGSIFYIYLLLVYSIKKIQTYEFF